MSDGEDEYSESSSTWTDSERADGDARIGSLDIGARRRHRVRLATR